MIAIIDSDIVAYRCAASAENEVTEDIAIWRVDDLMHRILHDVGATQYESYLSGKENFRKLIDPSYKANRTQPRPRWLELCREHLVIKWTSRIGDSIEADDLIGIAQSSYFEYGVASIVCSLDKDLKQLPGKHYNFVKNEFDFVTPLDGLKSFYRSLIIGDVADNVVGIRGKGKVAAAKLINPLNNEIDMYNIVKDLYKDDERFNKNCQLLWILRKENTPFSSPLEQQHGMETQP
jgi:5'-3' exonuclease